MKRAAIIGAGPIAASAAVALAERDITAEVWLVDEDARVASGKALDIVQSGAIGGSVTRIVGSASIDAVTGADVVVLADRAGAGGEWVGDTALPHVERLVRACGRAPLVFAGPNQRELLRAAYRELGVPAARLIGSAPEALRAAACALVAASAGAAASDVRVPVLGTPRAWMVTWSQSTIGGTTATELLSAATLLRLEELVQASWPPGAYACGAAAAAVVRAMATGSGRRVTAFTPIEHALDVRRAVVAVPVRVGPSGVVAVDAPSLTTRERVLLDNVLVP